MNPKEYYIVCLMCIYNGIEAIDKYMVSCCKSSAYAIGFDDATRFYTLNDAKKFKQLCIKDFKRYIPYDRPLFKIMKVKKEFINE